ncbi:MAG: LAGLIDADG family homing endonuclease [Candidatus Micrarchaeota archaeon]
MQNAGMTTRGEKFLEISLQPLVDKHATVANFAEIKGGLTAEQAMVLQSATQGEGDRRKWFDGRAYFPLRFFVQSFGDGSGELFRVLEKARFSKKGASSGKVRLPFILNEDLAYFLGVHAGDGCIPIHSPGVRGSWTVGIYEGYPEFHLEVCRPLIETLFGVTPAYNSKPRPDGRSNYYTAIHSAIAVNYLVECLGIRQGKKAGCVEVPKFVLNVDSPGIKAAFISGLFDTDGTVTGRDVRFSTVSKKLFEQVNFLLGELGLNTSFNTWLKAERYKLLYTISIKSCSKSRFQEIIGFRHPLKKLKLEKILRSPVV